MMSKKANKLSCMDHTAMMVARVSLEDSEQRGELGEVEGMFCSGEQQELRL
jgi:hypothetical protein